MEPRVDLRRVSAVEYFKELVDEALVHQHVAAEPTTEFYLVNLLAGFLHRRADDDQALALQLSAALENGGMARRDKLRQIGDLSLFVSGFFSASLQHRLVGADYYVHIGGFAYHSLSRVETDKLSPVFAELSGKFVAFVDVLDEVSERSFTATNQDLLRLYEKWLLTGSQRSGQLLCKRGVAPNPAFRKLGVQ